MKVADRTWKYKYMLVFINHYTRYTWVFPLITRDMALKALQIFKAAAEKASGQLLHIGGRDWPGG